MFRLLFYILLIVLVFYLFKNKVIIKFGTFLSKGFTPLKNDYGIYCYWNKQGSSKTQNVVSFLLDNKDKRIYANVKSLKGIHYKYFSGWNTLLDIGTKESNCIIFYDELFKGLYKGKKMTNEQKEKLMDFMSQMRKREIICITTAQEWLEVPIEFRRYVRFDIKCKLKNIFGRAFIVKEFNDTTQIKWDEIENEYISPRIRTIVEKGRQKVVNSYDTFETISNEENEPIDMFTPYEEETPQNEPKNTELEPIEILQEEEAPQNEPIDNDFWDENLGIDIYDEE